MKQPRTKKTPPVVASAAGGNIALRLDPEINQRFEKIVRVTRRTKTSVIVEGLEAVLPILEKRFAADLEAAA